MTLLRFDPFRDLDRWSEQAWRGGRTRVPTLAFDAYRREQELALYFDLPGVDPESIEVTVEKGSLTVAAERPSARREGDEVVVAERATGRFTRQLLLGEGLDTEAVRADYDAGVLTIVVPVADAVRPRKVQVNVGASSHVIDTTVAGGEGDAPRGSEAAA